METQQGNNGACANTKAPYNTDKHGNVEAPYNMDREHCGPC